MKTDNTFKDLPPLRRRAFIGQMFAAAGFVGSGLQQTRAAEKKANEPYPGFVSPHAQEWSIFKPEIPSLAPTSPLITVDISPSTLIFPGRVIPSTSTAN